MTELTPEQAQRAVLDRATQQWRRSKRGAIGWLIFGVLLLAPGITKLTTAKVPLPDGTSFVDRGKIVEGVILIVVGGVIVIRQILALRQRTTARQRLGLDHTPVQPAPSPASAARPPVAPKRRSKG